MDCRLNQCISKQTREVNHEESIAGVFQPVGAKPYEKNMLGCQGTATFS